MTQSTSSDWTAGMQIAWDRPIDFLSAFIFRPMLKLFVVASFTANRMAAMPVRYKLA